MLFDCIISQLIVKGISKTHLISLVLMSFFSKTHQSSLTLKGGSTAFPKPLSPQGTGGCANRPTRCSNRFAIRLADHQRSSPAAELHFAVCDRMDTRERRSCRKAKKPIAARHDGQEAHGSSTPEGAEAPSPGQRPGYKGNEQCAL